MTQTRPAWAPDRPGWHAQDSSTVLRELDTAPWGLDPAERSRRLAHHGPNTYTGRGVKAWWRQLADSVTEPLQLLLIAVAVLSAVFGEPSDAVAIGAVIVVVAVLETVTEQRAARAIHALKALTAPTARVVTPPGVVPSPVADLVVGDVITVEAGDAIPADARVLSAQGLRTDESTLTGEATPVGKDATAVPPHTELAERSSLLHAGTAVVAGEGRAVVVATGAASQLGQLGRLVDDSVEPPSPLQVALGQLARAVLVLAIAASVAVAVVGVLAGQPWRQMLLAGLTVAFATVPEELPILVVVLLAVGGRQLARSGALLRRLRAGETLGAVTTVVTDKTGTLTHNTLRLHHIIGPREQVLDTALHCQAPEGSATEPMERELAAAARAAGLTLRGQALTAFPFDPTRKRVSRAWLIGDTIHLAVSGAPEAVLGRCDLDRATRSDLDTQITDLGRRGMRVIAFATRTLPEPPDEPQHAETHLTYRGLAAFTDPLRADVPTAVATLTTAGVATIMVTGDHPATASAIAGQAGLPPGPLLTGTDVAASDRELDTSLRHGTVVARATPTTKHRIVGVLQRRGEIVAVTGDGANDAPALAAADVGIAIGRRGADLARAAADLVLTDDAYPTVTAAIAKGRNITAQLRRAVAFYLGAKLALVTVILTALAMGHPVPFQPVHIVILEIFMDLGASVAFVAEPAAPAAMHRPPRPPGSRFLDSTTLAAIALTAIALTTITLPAYLIVATTGGAVDSARSAAMLAWLAGHALIAWTLRTQPGLSWAPNPAFPAWAGLAIVTGLVLTLTPAGALVHLTGLAPSSLPWLALLVGLTIATTATARRTLRLTTRL